MLWRVPVAATVQGRAARITGLRAARGYLSSNTITVQLVIIGAKRYAGETEPGLVLVVVFETAES